MEKMHWIKGAGVPDDDLTDEFKKIKPNQNFYINKQHPLVIAFDKYEVAQGYMGLVEFKILTKLIQKDLVSNQYVK